MKVSQLIEELQTFCRPDDDIIVDYWLRDSFSVYDVDADEYRTPSVENWSKVVQEYNNDHHVYMFVQSVISEIVEDIG